MWKHVLLSVAASGVAATAFAQTPLVVDQSNDPVAVPPNSLAVGGQSDQYLAQTVTVGIAGRLWEVRLPIGCATGTLVLEIRDVGAGGEPGPRVFHTQTYTAERHPELFPPSLTSDFRVLRLTGRPLNFAIGDTFTIVVSNGDSADDPTASCGLWPADDGDTYPYGQGWYLGSFAGVRIWYPLETGLLGDPPQDLPFQTVMFRTGRR